MGINLTYKEKAMGKSAKNGKEKSKKKYVPSIPPEVRAPQWSAENQPSPEAKKRGWERKRVKQEIMNEMTKLDGLTMAEFEELRKDIEKRPERHTVREARLLRYMTREKFIKDYLDRNVGKAPQDVDITSGGKSMSAITVEHVHVLPEPKKMIEENIVEGERVEDEIKDGEEDEKEVTDEAKELK